MPGPARVAVPERLARKLATAAGAEWRAADRARLARASLARQVARAHAEGYSVRAIAETIDASVAHVHKLIGEGAS